MVHSIARSALDVANGLGMPTDQGVLAWLIAAGEPSVVVALRSSAAYDHAMARILDAICEAIEASDKTRYRIAKDTGISQAQLSRLLSGERGLSIPALERLADDLGLEIVIRRKKRRKGGE